MDVELLAADSFRVRMVGGIPGARAFPNHLNRFAASAVAVWGASHGQWTNDTLRPFLRTVADRCAAYGEGFPRLEVWSDGRLELALRPLPPLTETLQLTSVSDPERSHARIKGPGIERHSALNRWLGTEAILLDADSHTIEGATTSFVWWHQGRLHRVANQERVASVTEALVTGAAREKGTGVVEADISPEDLVQHEVWALNALHGIRQVTHIDGVALPDPDVTRLKGFRSALESHWAPLR